MKTFLLFLSLLTCASSSFGASLNLERKAKALDLLQKVIVPSPLTREVTSADEKIAKNCVRRQEKFVVPDPTTQNPMDVEFTSYYAKGATKTILVMPPTGGVSDLDFNYAKAFCSSGMNAIIVLNWTGNDIQEVDPGMHDRNTLRSVLAVRGLLSTIDSAQVIGIVGNSVGGIIASLVMGLEERIKAGVFVVAGGGMSEIISQSTEQNLTALRDLRMSEFGFTEIGQYFELIDNAVVIDAIDFTQSGKQVAMIVSNNDDTVPTQAQYDLVSAWGGDDVIFKKAPPFFNHIATIVHTSVWWTDDITDYFLQNL